MTAAGVAVFDALTAPGFMEAVNARSQQLSEGLSRLSTKWGMKGERGTGLLRALMLDRPDGSALVQAAMQMQPDGLLLNSPRSDLLRFMPALNITADEMDLMLSRLDEIITVVRS